MRLEEIKIENFKGLKDVTFKATKFSCLVGENNAGKSSVLQAIVYGLNRPPSLSSLLFHDPGKPISFSLRLSGVTENHLNRLAPEHRARIEPLISGSQLQLVVRYLVDGKLEIRVLKETPIIEKYQDDHIDELLKGKRGNAVRTAVVEAYSEFAEDAPVDMNIGQAKQYLRERIGDLSSDNFRLTEAPLPSGISSSITLLLPEPIYIPAVKNLSDDLKTTQSTSFGRLLGLLLEEMAPDLAMVTDALSQLNRLLNRVPGENGEIDDRHPKVKDLESQVEKYLRQNFPRVQVDLRIPPPELRTILNSAQIYIDDGCRDLIDNKGDGIKRSLTFALLQAYVDQLARATATAEESETAARPLLFLFEEPELYLHPKSQKVLFDTLSQISAAHQVVVTTHSPLFFSPGVTAGFVRVAKKPAQPKPVGVLHPVDFELDSASAEIFRLARFENADVGFFCGRVILLEGESDDSFFKHVAKMLNPKWDFDQANIGIIRVSGKGNFARYRRFFEAFGIEVKIVADLDAFFDGFQHLGADEATSPLRAGAISKIDHHIERLGVAAEPAARQIKDRIGQDSWRARYEAARAALRNIQQTQAVTAADLEQIDGLFIWEKEIARVKVCREDAEARLALIPTIDALRRQGICILSKGAIEDYYPAGSPTGGQKPERALAAARLVASRENAAALSLPLSEGRPSEFEEIVTALFDGMSAHG